MEEAAHRKKEMWRFVEAHGGAAVCEAVEAHEGVAAHGNVADHGDEVVHRKCGSS